MPECWIHDHVPRTQCQFRNGCRPEAPARGQPGFFHGEASTIVLPHVLRWNLPKVTDKLARIAHHLGLCDADIDDAVAADNLINMIENFSSELGIVSRLRDLGVDEAALPAIAEHAAHDFVMASNPRAVNTVDEVLEVLQAAY